MAHMTCPTCRLALHTRNALSVEYCPRCLARRHKAVPLNYVPSPPRPVRRSGGQATA